MSNRSRVRAARQAGLTMVEMMVVLVVAAVLVRFVVPSFANAITRYRVMTEANALMGDLQYARSEAIKRGSTVQMCMSTDGATCATSATGWMSGYLVVDPSATTPKLRQQNAFAGTDTMVASITSGTAPTVIAFNREGFAGVPTGWNSFSSLSGNLHIKVQDAALATAGLCVVVSKVGQVSLVAGGASDSFGTSC